MTVAPRCRIMYLETVDSATSKPSLSNSPWMRGAPQWILSAHLPNELAQLTANPGPTRSPAGFPGPVGSKARSMPAHDRTRLNDARQAKQVWPEPCHPDN